jgi:hypothetical protein
MANTSVIRGLVSVRSFARSGYANAVRRYSCPSTYATALFPGDPVLITGTADADGYSEINAATNGSSISGVVVGFEDAASLALGYGAASTTRAVLVDDDPESLFEVQEDAVGGALAAADVGLNCDLISAAGSTTQRTSGWQLDTSTKATTATLQCKIVEIQHRADNEFATAGVANTKVLVKINKHTALAAVAGI